MFYFKLFYMNYSNILIYMHLYVLPKYCHTNNIVHLCFQWKHKPSDFSDLKSHWFKTWISVSILYGELSSLYKSLFTNDPKFNVEQKKTMAISPQRIFSATLLGTGVSRLHKRKTFLILFLGGIVWVCFIMVNNDCTIVHKSRQQSDYERHSLEDIPKVHSTILNQNMFVKR